MGAGELARAPKASCFQTVVSNHQKAVVVARDKRSSSRMDNTRACQRMWMVTPVWKRMPSSSGTI